MKKKTRKLLIWVLILIFFAAFVWSAVWYWKHRLGSRVEPLETLLCDDSLYDAEIRAAAAKYDLPPELVRALVKRESRFNARATGKAGEIGLMQILPSGAVAEWARVNKCPAPSTEELYNVTTNLDIGCWYLARSMRKWKDYRYCMHLALAEYNAGPRHTARWKPADPKDDVLPRIDFPGTKEYVQVIMETYRGYVTSKQ